MQTSSARRQGPPTRSAPHRLELHGWNDAARRAFIRLAGAGVELPATVDEDLSTRPSVQGQLQKLSAPLRPQNAEQQQNYLNFHGNLIKASDAYLVQILDTLEEQGLLETTLFGSPVVNPDWQGVDYAALVLEPATAGRRRPTSGCTPCSPRWSRRACNLWGKASPGHLA